MAWDDLTWRLKVWRSNGTLRGGAIILGVILYLAAPIAAPLVFGARGYLFGLVLQWLVAVGLGGLFAVLFFFGFRVATSGWKWASLAGLLVFGDIFLYAAVQEVLSSADLVLPFARRDVTVSRTYYEHPQTGRGAMPESGGWHIVSADGDDYRVRDYGDGDDVKPGRYRLVVSRLKHIVMSAKPE